MEILNAIVWTGRSLVLQFADDHYGFHEDAKPGDLSLQSGTSSFNSSKKFWTRMSWVPVFSSLARSITNR